MDKREKTVRQNIEEVIEEICGKYCKYPDQWDGEGELWDSEICKNCPLNRL